MAKYQIKGEFVNGRHAGKWFILEKGGHVHFNPDGYKFPFNCYLTAGAAKMVCSKLNKRETEIHYSIIEVK